MAPTFSMTSTSPVAIAVIDPRVMDAEWLRSQVQPGTVAVVLERDRDGLTQLAEVLERFGGSARSLHVLAHGRPGALRLGSSTLDARSLFRAGGVFGRWRDRLAQSPELVLYGCRVAATAAGQSFLRALADQSGMVVRAARSWVGQAARGGSWSLDFVAGPRDRPALAPLVLGSAARSVYGGIFADDCFPNQFYGVMNLDGDGQNDLVTVDLSSGAINRIISSTSGLGFNTNSLARRPGTNDLYFLSSQAGTAGNLYKWSPPTTPGDNGVQLVANANTVANGILAVGEISNVGRMAFDSFGNLFVSIFNKIIIINPDTGRAVYAENLVGTGVTEAINLNEGTGDLAFDPNIANDPSARNRLYISFQQLGNSGVVFNNNSIGILEIETTGVSQLLTETQQSNPGGPGPNLASFTVIRSAPIAYSTTVLPATPLGPGPTVNMAGLAFGIDGRLYSSANRNTNAPAFPPIIDRNIYPISTGIGPGPANFDDFGRLGTQIPNSANLAIGDLGTLPVQTPEVQLKVDKSDGLDVAEPGQAITYTVTIENLATLSNGKPGCDIKAPFPVSLSDTFPADFIPVEWTSSVSGVGAVDPIRDQEGSIDLQNVKLTLNAGASVTFIIKGNISANPTTTTLSNTFRATLPDGIIDPDSPDKLAPQTFESTDTTILNRPPIAQGKTNTIAPSAAPQTVNYTLASIGITGSDPDTGNTLTQVKFDSVPVTGTLEYFDGANWIQITAGTTIPYNAATQIRYTTPGGDLPDNLGFAYRLLDSSGAANNTSAPATISFTDGQNQPPVAQSFSTGADENATVDLSGEIPISDPDVGPAGILDYVIQNPPNQGTLYLDNDNDGVFSAGDTVLTAGSTFPAADVARLKYDSPAGFTGTSFTYVARDRSGQPNNTSAVATVTIARTPANQIPDANSGSFQANAANPTAPIPISALAPATDDGTITGYKLTKLPTTGQLRLADGTPVTSLSQVANLSPADFLGLQYIPPASGFSGADFSYVAIDNEGAESAPATVNFNPAANQAPSAFNSSANIIAGSGPIPLTGANVSSPLGGDDPDVGGGPNDTLGNFIIDKLPEGGTLTLNGNPVVVGQPIPFANINDLVFTPNAGATDLITEFTYRVIDNSGASNASSLPGRVELRIFGKAQVTPIGTPAPTPQIPDEPRISVFSVPLPGLEGSRDGEVRDGDPAFFFFPGNKIKDGNAAGFPGLQVPCIEAGQTVVQRFRVQNTGTGILRLGDVILPEGFVLAGDYQRNLGAGEETFIPIAFTPTRAGVFTGIFRLSSNNTGDPLFNFPIAAVVCEFPNVPIPGVPPGLNVLTPTVPDRDATCAPQPTIAGFFLAPPVLGDRPPLIIPPIPATTRAIFAIGGEGEIVGTAENELVVGSDFGDFARGEGGDDELLGNDGNDTLFGGPGRDRVGGGTGDDQLNGNVGDDVLYGGDGNDSLNGGQDNDWVLGDRGQDTIEGDLGNDTLIGGVGQDGNLDEPIEDRDLIFGNDGDDVILASQGRDTSFGGQGNDIIHTGKDDDLAFGDRGQDTLLGEQGNDTLFGGTGFFGILDPTGADVLFGGDGNDLLFGNEGNDTLVGNTGNDRAFGGQDNDIIFGDEGNDTLLGDRGDDIIFGGVGRDAEQGTDPDDDLLFGGKGNDSLNGGQGDDTLYAGEDNDLVFGGKDNDLIFGDKGNDTLSGDLGNDTLFGGNGNPTEPDQDGADLLFGGGGNDWIFGDKGNDSILGGDGNDTLFSGLGDDYGWGGAGEDLIFGDRGNDTLCGNDGNDTLYGGSRNPETADDGNDLINGGDGNDLIYGNRGDDSLLGDLGDDTIYGGDGNDQIWSGPGNDLILGDRGNDTLHGGDGNDTIYGGNDNPNLEVDGSDVINGAGGDDLIYGNLNSDTLIGGDGSDTLYGGQGDDQLFGDGGDDLLSGDRGNDTLIGGDGNNLLYGGSGNDILTGGNGNSTLYGGQGDDLVVGGTGEDVLTGDRGNDTLAGGAGRDRFVLGDRGDGGTDTVLDFEVGTDTIELLGGLRFADLTLTAVDGGSATELRTGDRAFALLRAVTPSQLTASQFV